MMKKNRIATSRHMKKDGRKKHQSLHRGIVHHEKLLQVHDSKYVDDDSPI